MAARKHRKIHDVKLSEKMIPFITGEMACRQMSMGWFLVSTYLIWILVVQIDSKHNHTTNPAQLCGFGTRGSSSDFCLNDHFDHSHIVFKNVTLGIDVKRFCACDNVVHLGELIHLSVSVYLRFGVWVGVCSLSFMERSISRYRNVFRIMLHFSYHIPEIEGGKYRPCANQHPKK